MEVQGIEKLLAKMTKDLGELKNNSNSLLLKDRLKKNLLEAYELVDAVEVAADSVVTKQEEVSDTFVMEPKKEVKEEKVAEVELVPIAVEMNSPELNAVVPEEPETSGDGYDLFSEFLGGHETFEDISNEDSKEEIEEVEEVEEAMEIEEEVELKEEELDIPIVDKFREPLNDAIEQYKSKPITSLSSTIPIGKKFEFIEDLFIGNSEEYMNAIGQIDAMHEYNKAEEFLMINYFDKFGWSEKEKVLNNLFDFVTRRFAA